MRTRRNTGTDVALIAAFAALIAVCALLPAIKVAGPVPITLQTFAVLLSGAVLGMPRGFLAVLLYVVAGAAGLPIFSGGAAGLAVLTGPTAGYLIGFPLAAGLCGAIVERLPRRSLVSPVAIFCAGLISSALCIHTLGMAGLVLRADLLRPLAHWITPEVEPKRFDTRFFVARVPAGQVCRDVGTEADLRLWIRPADALTAGLTLMPPTLAALEDLAGHPDVEASLAAPRRLQTVLPRAVVDDDGEVRLVDLLVGD